MPLQNWGVAAALVAMILAPEKFLPTLKLAMKLIAKRN